MDDRFALSDSVTPANDDLIRQDIFGDRSTTKFKKGYCLPPTLMRWLYLRLLQQLTELKLSHRLPPVQLQCIQSKSCNLDLYMDLITESICRNLTMF